MSEALLESTGPAQATSRQAAARSRRPAARPRAHPPHLADFLDVRDRLLRIAGRIVGDETDAEDVVQDAWLRWDRSDRGEVRNVPAFLYRTTTLLSINAIQTAHVRHRSAAPAWQVERPDRGDDPTVVVERAEELRAALRLLVERLAPRERAAYLLREAFGFPHRQIGAALGLTDANARQLLRRARVRLTAATGGPASPVEQLRLLAAFGEVARTGDPAALVEVAREPVSPRRGKVGGGLTGGASRAASPDSARSTGPWPGPRRG
ncbi:sigma-70 family RNA polymerase sigma factor [Micromonospora sp. PLK6-60]|uniref:sigma-70 family RNA polymerase sigma factor n=1 Tax=Micromonospora sp. PLK6-60 TaxID=2873383 RepID=UPI001CA6B486|nr:sigma-70 family RNA polymerase sigma factor [Micromonospora sp. PLK6-60]MBY8870703.1 sigma-70 family RNA polymerase sigma factor [Micromonospora sp. PLK6-60]